MTTLPLLTPLNQVENPLINVFNTVIDGIQQLAVNARDLHSFLKVGRDFSNWIKGRIAQYVFIENQDYIVTLAKTGERKNVLAKEYHLTLDMAKELAMVENNEQGRKVRRYFIQCEKNIYKSDSQQRQALVTACDKLAVGYALRSDIYKMVGNHFGYDDVASIPTPLLPEAVAFVYEQLLAKQKHQEPNISYIANPKDSLRWIISYYENEHQPSVKPIPNDCYIVNSHNICNIIQDIGIDRRVLPDIINTAVKRLARL